MNADQLRRHLVLVVGDEDSFIEGLSVGLTREGFEVIVARDGVDALRKFEQMCPDLVLLDLMLPRLSGLEVCRRLRWQSKVPIIIVTTKSSEVDMVVGLELGADDYVAKPYRLRELVARMRAVLRRSNGQIAPQLGSEIITVGSLSIDVAQHVVEDDGRQVLLTLKEFSLLRCLMERAGQVVPRGELMEVVWGRGFDEVSKTLNVHIKKIRDKLHDDVDSPRRIITVRGVGYLIEGRRE